jgi:hypothetical protein
LVASHAVAAAEEAFLEGDHKAHAEFAEEAASAARRAGEESWNIVQEDGADE